MRAFVLTLSASQGISSFYWASLFSGQAGTGEKGVWWHVSLSRCDFFFFWKALNSISLLLVFINSPVDAETAEEHGEVHPISSFHQQTSLVLLKRLCMCIFHLESEGLYVWRGIFATNGEIWKMIFPGFNKRWRRFPSLWQREVQKFTLFYPLIDTHPLVNPLNCLHNCSWKSLKCESEFTLHRILFLWKIEQFGPQSPVINAWLWRWLDMLCWQCIQSFYFPVTISLNETFNIEFLHKVD